MAVEIERKFLVCSEQWKQDVFKEIPMRQGYFESAPGSTVRVRIEGERAVLTIKGPTVGLSRAEYEYEIPVRDAHEMLDIFCGGRQVQKVRHLLECGGHTWEVDIFEAENAGLIVAEVELGRADEVVELPEWVGEEVSHDRRYRNGYLARHPWTKR